VKSIHLADCKLRSHEVPTPPSDAVTRPLQISTSYTPRLITLREDNVSNGRKTRPVNNAFLTPSEISIRVQDNDVKQQGWEAGRTEIHERSKMPAISLSLSGNRVT
jgi:hypothetical protein